MDVVTPLMQTLQAQANIDHTRATAQDTQALAQQRMLGVLLNTQAAQRADEARQMLKDQQFNNPTAPGMAGPTGMPGSPGSNVFANYDYDSPLIQSARSAQQGVNTNRTLMQIAQKTGDLEMYQKAARDSDNQQKEFRLAMMDVTKDDERRNREAAQAFGQAKTPDDVRNSLQYVADNLGSSKAKAIEQQLAQALPGGIDNATEDQIKGALAPVLNKITARGNILRFTSAAQASTDRVNTLDEKKRVAQVKETMAAQAQAGVSNSELDPKTVDFYAEQSLKGDNSWQVGLARGKVGQQLIAAVKDRIPQMAAERDISPTEAVANKAGVVADTAALRDRTKFVAASNQFVRNMDKQITLVDGLLDAGSIDGVPALNRWIQAGRKQIAGDPDVTKLDVAIRGLAREHQRIVTGVTSNAQLHVSAQQTADELLNIAQTPDQIRGAISVMREEAENARQAGIEEIGEARSRLAAPLSGGSSAAPASTAKRGAADVQNMEAKPLTPDQIRTVAKMKGVAPVMGNEDFRALPKGTSFIGPDGLIRVKP